ncbi:MAG: RIP metalloprotease RseP [bacterium]
MQWSTSLIGIFGTIFLFGFAILIHEFGHFLLAKINRVGVESFAIGFGKKIFAVKWGETEYSLRWLPFGGFVKLQGMLSKEAEQLIREEEQAKLHEGEKSEKPLEPEEAKTKEASGLTKLAASVDEDMQALRNKNFFQKFTIFAAGPGMNYLSAIGFYVILLVHGMQFSAPYAPNIARINDTKFAEAGLSDGDVFVEVAHGPVQNWDDIFEASNGFFARSPDKSLPVKVKNAEGNVKELELPPLEGNQELYAEYFMPPAPAYVADVLPLSPADRAGLQSGDFIVEIDGTPVKYWLDMSRLIQQHPDDPTLLKVKRGAETLTMVLTPKRNPRDPSKGLIGIFNGNPEKEEEKYSLAEAILIAPRWTYRHTVLTVQLIGDLFKRGNMEEIRENVAGPIGIMAMANRAAKKGFVDYVYLLIAFSIALAIFNLLPIPVLDGGHIMIAGIETLVRRPIPLWILSRVYTVFVVLIVGFALFVTYNDVLRWVFKFN